MLPRTDMKSHVSLEEGGSCSRPAGFPRVPAATSCRACDAYPPILLGGAQELGIVYINIIRGAKEPRNLQNHRGVITLDS